MHLVEPCRQVWNFGSRDPLTIARAQSLNLSFPPFKTSIEESSETENSGYRFRKDAVASSNLMLLRRAVNHSFLVLERPPIFNQIPESSQDSVSSDLNDRLLNELLNASGKLRLLDRLLQKLISTQHKAS